MLIDADGLNSIAKYGRIDEVFSRKKCEVVLTPHVKEFSRLSGLSVAEILEDVETIVRQFANRYGVTLLLKNARTAISDGEKIFWNNRGNSGQAKGGSGDVLSGVVAGLWAQGISGLKAAACGAYLVGESAEIGAKIVGEYSLTASDLIGNLGRAFLL